MLTTNKKKSIQLGWRLYRRTEEAAWATKTGQAYVMRSATAADLPLMADLLTDLSSDSRYLRFLLPLSAFTPERAEARARQLWLENPWPSWVLLATLPESEQPGAASEKVIGLGELHLNPANPGQAEFALLVRDEWQGQGIGARLLDRLVALATTRGVRVLCSEIHPYNRAMRKILSRQERPVEFKFVNGTMEVSIKLAAPGGVTRDKGVPGRL